MTNVSRTIRKLIRVFILGNFETIPQDRYPNPTVPSPMANNWMNHAQLTYPAAFCSVDNSGQASAANAAVGSNRSATITNRNVGISKRSGVGMVGR